MSEGFEYCTDRSGKEFLVHMESGIGTYWWISDPIKYKDWKDNG